MYASPMKSWAVAVLGAIVACSSPAHHAPVMPTTAKNTGAPPPPAAPAPPAFRLPRHFVPTSHRASLSFVDRRRAGHPDELYFDGTMEIAGEVTERAPVIWLHALDLDVRRATASHAGHTLSLAVTPQPEHETIALTAPAPFEIGPWTLTIEYRGRVRDHGVVDISKWLAEPPDAIGAFSQVVTGRRYTFTHFEPMDARRVFPCIDEPDRKVPWQLTLEIANSDTAVSNTPVLTETPIGHDRKRITFAPTPPLPSYLVAFAIGPFAIVDTGTSPRGIHTRIVALHDQAPDAAWAKGWPSKILDAIEAWTDIPYPYKKLDFVAVPRTDSHWDAMENAGMVTFAASLLNRPSSWVGVMEHELSHQWFGDLVTQAWWDDIWLSESFASWMTGKLRLPAPPPNPPLSKTELEQRRASWQSDSEPDTIRPPSTAVESRAELARYFQTSLGRHLVDDLEQQLGPAGFQRAIRTYLRTYAGKNASSADLSAILSATAGYPLDATIRDRLDNVPVPKLAFSVVCNGQRPKLRVSRTAPPDHSVPFCFIIDRDGGRADRCVVVEGRSMDIELDSNRCPTWIVPTGGSLIPVAWGPTEVRDVLAHGWSRLTAAEQVAVYDRSFGLSDLSLQLTVILRMAQSNDPSVSDRAAFVLSTYIRYVPPNLRGRFVTWVKKRFLARARAIDLRAISDPRQPSVLGVLSLIAAVRDPVLAKRAVEIANEGGSGSGARFNTHEAILTLAADADRRIADRLYNQSLDSDFVAVSRSRFVIDVAKAHPDVIRRPQVAMRLLSGRCDAARRAEVSRLPLDPRVRNLVLRVLDECIAESKRLEPTFRAELSRP